MPLMPVTESMFLLGESREHPLHVGGLQLFELPEGAGPDYVGELHRALLAADDIHPLLRRRPRGPVSTVGQWVWTDDDRLDLDYHVRLSALPTPGRVRELLELVSRLHGSLLDRHRPLWEAHLVEGLRDNRFALYTKAHHALLDGVSALRLLQRSLTTDPAVRDPRPPWANREDERPEVATRPRAGVGAVLRDIAGLGPAFARYANEVFRAQTATLPFAAPRSILNVPITGARRFAAQGWPLARVRAVGEKAGATVNDVMLAMCAGALRRYLLELDALPERPLVAAVPMSLRGGDDSAGGNALGMILCTLATDLADPADRLAAITESTRSGKDVYRGMSQLQVTALSAIPFAPLALGLLPGAVRLTPPAFNLMISNVPGPTEPLYWNGARMLGVYPVSIPYEGQALNITVTSYNGSLEFGLTGCRRTVPHLQRLLTHLDTELADLESAV
ncbi:WS/DGAT/MGAT family O-acyltransferase [Actinokineospora globicatena]|uniref:WS/DGAT/MGAT family O-acyltransferase n=1 Tax=Actinokineospora globicatena TaxID=103729 RepID=UPI0020A32899|nr:wax ester/triacylglycerol synthase family O-acyltransferase [Actinokineospora globicatena]MCP2302214.1 acyltransferase, WS/DGAT/MGAT [Actinokineospora globicatena]GLW76122.1 diacylglycerol O-acyltransferase [Actinokineospora globicatena]GLW82957.1 diacylglycerol O-acyltransferase [Actinokineospora globicatena]